MRTGEGRIPAGDLRTQAGVSCSVHRSFDSSPGVGQGRSRSGFRPTDVVEGATGLPVEIHRAGAVSLQGIFYW
jgi:hypothetical protein